MPHTFHTGDPADHSFQPVSPVDIVQPKRTSTGPANGNSNEKPVPSEQTTSVKSPRSARFAEDTAVVSPVEPQSRSPFADPPPSKMPDVESSSAAPKASDVGFSFYADSQPERHATFPETPRDATLRANGPGSPLKSALKTPGAPGNKVDPLSPTFREEKILEHHEKQSEKDNAKDVKIKTRVRLAKVLLRGVSFSCSLIILALVAQSFVIFNATKNLAARNSKTPWDPDTNAWPQILVLVVASISIFLAVGVFWGYCRGGHRRAEKVSVYYTMFAVFIFAASIVVWVVVVAVFQNSKSSGGGKDLWGWACVDNPRATAFEDDVDYGLVCRMQDWVLICVIIEIIVDILVISIYAVVFYRFYSKRKLRKTMDARDKARSDLYLAHLRSQTAPNTPGFPRSPEMKQDPMSAAENGQSYSTQYATPRSPTTAITASHQPFQLQPPPSRTPHNHTNSNSNSSRANSLHESLPPMSPGFAQRVNDHNPAAPGEKTYESVPIPGSYTAPVASPTPQQAQFPRQEQDQSRRQSTDSDVPGRAITSDKAVEGRAS